MDANFVQAIKDTVRDALADVHTALPATIKTFDAGTGLASVAPAGKFKTVDGKALDYPVITGVPVVFQYSPTAGAGILFPVKAGDNCLLVIAEQALDSWLYGGESASDLKHDLTNAVAIPGLYQKPQAKIANACSDDAVVVYAGETSVVISKGGVAIKGNVTITGNLTTSGGTVRLN